MFYVYVLKSEKTRFLYMGFSNNLKARVVAHNSERTSREFTQRNKPWKLIYYEAYFSEQDARDREVALKKYGASLGQLRKRLKRSLESAG
ncbi:MAG: GIY-YIG nuclease family protein [Candidatus Taylorbacteria bacterium]|nr:GIY-YIG nuclease family protein [Candidatus Taylorbacteria bacterium]